MSSQTAIFRLHQRLNHDFCPWLNPWVYWMKDPFWIILASAVTALTCGLLVSRLVLFLCAALFAVISVGVLWPWLSLRGLEGRLRFPFDRARVGQPIPVEVTLRNRCPWPIWGLELKEGFCVSLDRTTSTTALACIRGWSTVTFTWKFHPPKRGVYPLKTTSIETRFPFGLFRATRDIVAENHLIAWPQSTTLDAIPPVSEPEFHGERWSDRRAGHSGDVVGTRSFRQGDSLRRVHWAQSARQGRLIVCERQSATTGVIRVVLDLSSRNLIVSEGENSLEQTLSVAASILESLHRTQTELEFVIGDETIRVGPTLYDLNRCLDRIAMIPDGGLTAESTVVSSSASRRRTSPALSFLVTTANGLADMTRAWGSHSRVFYIVLVNSHDHGCDALSGHGICTCRPRLELSIKQQMLADLSRQWKRACLDC